MYSARPAISQTGYAKNRKPPCLSGCGGSGFYEVLLASSNKAR